jgi:hypothetical protein
MARAAQTEAKPTIEPTETSMAPDTMTTVWAIATMPRIAMADMMAARLRVEKKASGRSVPKIATKIRRAASRLRF